MTDNSFYSFNKINTFIEKKYWLIKKIGIVFTGLLLLNWMNPFDKSYTPYARAAPIHIEVRWCLFALGVIIVIYGIFSKASNKIKSLALICPICETVFTSNVGDNSKKMMCADCKVLLEPLEGYYDRHPERRDIEEQNIKQEDEDN